MALHAAVGALILVVLIALVFALFGNFNDPKNDLHD
jgi:hypothetical protein